MRYTSSLTSIPRGAKGTRMTLSAMEKMVEQGIRDPRVVLFAQELVRNGPEYGKAAELDSILRGVRRVMRYTPDPLGVETVKTPSFIVQEIKDRGRAVMDCDDASVLTAALVRSIGTPTRFKVIKDSPTEFTHVYLEAFLDDGWVKVDPIARELSLGAAPEGRFGSAYFEGGKMYRGMGAAPVGTQLEDAFSASLKAFTDYQTQRFTQPSAPKPTVQKQIIVQGGEPFPWGKIALVAGAGIGLIIVLRMLRKKR